MKCYDIKIINAIINMKGVFNYVLQIVLLKVANMELEEIDKINKIKTNRNGGFRSTGIK